MQQNLIDAARAAFEFEMLQENIIDDEGLERDDDTGEYIDEPAAAAWKAWQLVNDKAARASLHPDAAQEKPAGEAVAVVDESDDGMWADILPDRNVRCGQLLYTAPPVPSDAFALLEIWQTWLGAGRESCSEHDKPLWDRIDAVLASKEPKHD